MGVSPGLEEYCHKYRTDGSKTLNKAERNYYFIRRELLAIVRTLECFREYLYGQELHLRTDVSACWFQHLQEYNFICEHRQGWKHQNANALS